VNGVGPKVGLSILSTLSPEVIRGAIAREETAVLQRVPGIGKKTAERIMFQLRDKLDLTADVSVVSTMRDVDADVIDVLTSLGFSIIEAQTALQNIPRDESDLDMRVQLAHQYLDQT
jgi:Holliday junction DNA helicase RuvA